MGALALIILGVTLGWRLAALLGVGAAGGSAASVLIEAQRRREVEAQRLRMERQALEDRAKQTDQMINDYYKHRGGTR